MAVTLVTGAPGLVGSHVARAVVRRGDRVRATVRSGSPTENLEGLELERVACDLLDRRAVRRAMRDVERGASLWWAFRSTKARRELGWQPAHHEDMLEATIAWYREREPARLARPGAGQPLGLRLAGGLVRQAGGLAARLVP